MSARSLPTFPPKPIRERNKKNTIMSSTTSVISFLVSRCLSIRSFRACSLAAALRADVFAEPDVPEAFLFPEAGAVVLPDRVPVLPPEAAALPPEAELRDPVFARVPAADPALLPVDLAGLFFLLCAIQLLLTDVYLIERC